MKNYTVVYNKFNHEAVIAAAILVSSLERCKTFDITQRIDGGDEDVEYIWIGVEPVEGVGNFDRNIASKNQTVFSSTDGSINAKTKTKKPFMFFGSYFQEEEHKSKGSDCDLGLKRTLIDKVCEHFGIESREIQTLAFHSGKFHDKGTNIDYLAYVWKNVMLAQKCLLSGEKYKVTEHYHSDIDAYYEAMSGVTVSLRQSSEKVLVQDGTAVKSAIYTTISDSSYHLALRLIKLSDNDFLNMSMGLNGSVVYSNMRQLKFNHNMAQPILLS